MTLITEPDEVMNAAPMPTTCSAFLGERLVAHGPVEDIVLTARTAAEAAPEATLLLFDDATGRVVDMLPQDTPAAVRERLAGQRTGLPSAGDAPLAQAGENTGAPADSSRPGSRGRGRPKLGVVAREVTLLPRHWDWLASQPGSASVALRRLVDEARRTHAARDRRREAQEAAYRFMSAMAGNRPHFEEATRALFAGDERRFGEQVAAWPADIRQHAQRLAAGAFTHETHPAS